MWLASRRCLGLVALLATCAEPQALEPEEPMWNRLGDTHVAPPGTGAPDTRPPLQEPPASVRALEASIATLRGTARVDHEVLARTFEQLAASLVVLAPDRPVDIARIREAADQLASTPLPPREGAGVTRDALAAAIGVLSSLEPEHPVRSWRLERHLAISLRAVRAFDPAVPPSSQHARLVEALDAVADTVRVAYGSAAPSELVGRSVPGA